MFFPFRIASRISSIECESIVSVVYASPIVSGICESLPPTIGKHNFLAILSAILFSKEKKEKEEFITSIASGFILNLKGLILFAKKSFGVRDYGYTR